MVNGIGVLFTQTVWFGTNLHVGGAPTFQRLLRNTVFLSAEAGGRGIRLENRHGEIAARWDGLSPCVKDQLKGGGPGPGTFGPRVGVW